MALSLARWAVLCATRSLSSTADFSLLSCSLDAGSKQCGLKHAAATKELAKEQGNEVELMDDRVKTE